MDNISLVSHRMVSQVNQQLWWRGGLCLPRLTGADRLVRIEVQPANTWSRHARLASGRLLPISWRQWQSLLLVLGLTG